MPRESYEASMKRMLKESREQTEDQKHSNYWRHSAARHIQEIERTAERRQQAELAGSMRAEAINNAPIDELRKELVDTQDVKEELYKALSLLNEAWDVLSEVLHKLEK